MARPKIHDENLRVRLLGHARALVTERGIAALSLRGLATDAGTSTTAVYSLFGGKFELLTALFEESLKCFAAAQKAVPISGKVEADLMALSHAYQVWARDHSHLYILLFEQPHGEYAFPDKLVAVQTIVEPLAGVVRSGVQSGLLVGDPAVITFTIWAAVHGVVYLNIAGYHPESLEVTTQLVVAALVHGWLSGATGVTPSC